jgi:hypothetical protein
MKKPSIQAKRPRRINLSKYSHNHKRRVEIDGLLAKAVTEQALSNGRSFTAEVNHILSIQTQ